MVQNNSSRNRYSAKSFAFLLDFVDQPVCIINEYGRFQYCNHAFTELSGYAIGQILGKRYKLLFDKSDYPALTIRNIIYKIHDITAWSGPIRFSHADGSRREGYLHVKPLLFPGDNDNSPSYFVQIEKSETRISSTGPDHSALLMEHTSDIVFTFNLDANRIPGKITQANKRLSSIADIRMSRLLEKNFLELVPPASQSEILQALDSLNDKKDFNLEFSLSVADGREVMLRGRFFHVQKDSAVVVIARNVSEQKALENKMSQLEKLEAVGQLAGGIAHDFNNVLAGISGLAELGMRKLDEEHKAYPTLKTIYQKANNAANIVRQLVMFSRKQRLNMREMNLNRVIRNNSRLLERYLGEDVTLSIRLSENLNLVNADASALDQIITNLSINARDAMPDGGELVVSTENRTFPGEKVTVTGTMPAGDYVLLNVIDSGTGMPRETLRHIFEPFFTTKDVGQGTGLGLSIVFGLVKQHNAFIECASSEGEGTHFTIYFPKIAETIKEMKSAETRPVVGGNECILIAEDEADLILFMKEVLENFGYRIMLAPNGSKALEIFQEHADSIDMIVSDVVMPEMNGVELKLVAEKIKPDMKFLLISAYTNRLEPGVPFLEKPFDARDFAQAVRSILDGTYKLHD